MFVGWLPVTICHHGEGAADADDNGRTNMETTATARNSLRV